MQLDVDDSSLITSTCNVHNQLPNQQAPRFPTYFADGNVSSVDHDSSSSELYLGRKEERKGGGRLA
jgi:hypothetical protein